MKCLVVVDMQNDFIYGSLATREAQEIVDNVMTKVKNCKKNKYEIYFTEDTHKENYLETLEGQRSPIKHCIYGTTGWEIIDDLKPYVKLTYQKPTFSCMGLINYIHYMRESVESVEIIGVHTNLSVVSNALIIRGVLPDVPITVDASCCAGTTPELHKAALDIMNSCQIDIINEEK